MGVYFALLLIPVSIQHFAVKEEKVNYTKKNRLALLFFFSFLTLLIMLRHESVGSDTRNYIDFFERFRRMPWGDVGKDSLEFGFAYFNKIISFFVTDPRVFLAIAAITVSAMIYPTYRRLCTDASLTIVLYCFMSTFVMMFSGMRQMIAIGIGFIAYEFTRKKKLGSFILIAIVAISFHTSAFMLLFMYPLYHAKITKKWLYAVIPILIAIFVFNEQVFLFIINILEKYTKYDGTITKTGAYVMLILFAFFAVFVFLIPEESLLDEETVGLRNFLLLSLIVQMFAPLHAIAMRMSYYYIIFIPLLIPKIIKFRSKRWEQVAVLGRHIMVVFFLAYFFFSAYTKDNNLNVFPYHFFWEVL